MSATGIIIASLMALPAVLGVIHANKVSNRNLQQEEISYQDYVEPQNRIDLKRKEELLDEQRILIISQQQELYNKINEIKILREQQLIQDKMKFEKEEELKNKIENFNPINNNTINVDGDNNTIIVNNNNQ